MKKEDSGAKRTKESKIPRVIAIVSGKGGTGKSIVVASMGYVMAHCGFRVLLIDTDLFTRGLSFYLVADEPYLAQVGLSELLFENSRVAEVDQIRISDKFARANLFLIPATANLKACIPKARDVKINLHKMMADKLGLIVSKARGPWKFDYVIFDTRGGTDETAMAAVRAANGYVVITEADKTSWDVSALLLNEIENFTAMNTSPQVKRLGFVLNKNTLPEKEVISFLRRSLGCRDLAVIPLDIEAVRCFQNDKVPVAEDVTTPFSHNIITLCRELFRPDEWEREKIKRFEEFYHRIREETYRRERVERERRLNERFRYAMTIVTQLLIIMLVVWMVVGSKFFEKANVAVFVLIACLAAMSFLSSDAGRKIIKTLVRILGNI